MLGQRCFLFQAPISFSEYFSSYSSGGFDLTLFLFWFKGKGKKKNLKDLSIIYRRRHLRPGFKVDFWISILTHAHQEASLTSWEESSVGRCVWLTPGTSDVLTQNSVSQLWSGASLWWKGLLGNSSSHQTRPFALWPLLLFSPWKRNSWLSFKILQFNSFSIQQILIESLCLFCATQCAKSYRWKLFIIHGEGGQEYPGLRLPGFLSQLCHLLDMRY